MDIVIVSQYLRDIECFEGNNSRFVYLAKLLSENKDNHVEIITSNFCHSAKKHFSSVGELQNIKITALDEPGYPKNVCLKRFASHRTLAKNILKYLKNRKIPDACYCAVPSLDVADAVSAYCKKNHVRFIVDVQDLWPEAFKMVFNIPIISDMIFLPMKIKANRIYGTSDEIVAVSQTYADRALRVNKKCKAANVVYLGTEKESFDKYADGEEIEEDCFTVVYIGSMSESYDLVSVIDAIAGISEHSIKLLAMGDGAKREKFENYAKERGINAEFTGKLPYPQMVCRLTRCDVAVNPIHKGSAGSIINKVGDYAMASLPVINTQECVEYRNLLEQYNSGINCDCENSDQIRNAIIKLFENDDLRKQMAFNSEKLAVERFDRKNTYCNIVKILSNTGEE